MGAFRALHEVPRCLTVWCSLVPWGSTLQPEAQRCHHPATTAEGRLSTILPSDLIQCPEFFKPHVSTKLSGPQSRLAAVSSVQVLPLSTVCQQRKHRSFTDVTAKKSRRREGKREGKRVFGWGRTVSTLCEPKKVCSTLKH